MKPIQLIATSTFGLEAVVKRELLQLGYQPSSVSDGKVTIPAAIGDIPRVNLWLRSADRVLLKMGEFPASDFDQLFDGTRALAWEEWIPQDGSFPVTGKSVKSTLSSVPACQAMVKKAVVEKLKETHHLERFPETGPLFPIQVSLLNDTATLTIDTSGQALHKRGYRDKAVKAPLKETLAAALVQLSFWKAGRLLVDPLCGSGTIPIEAALIGRNIPPGLNRSFAAEQWPSVPAQLWADARQEARDLAGRAAALRIQGLDSDRQAVEKAQANARKAGVADSIRFSTQALEHYTIREPYGVVITNPPYGERLGKWNDSRVLYRQLGNTFGADPTWSVYVLTPEREFERFFRKQADRKRKLFNGTIEVHYYQYYGKRPPGQG